MLEIWDVNTLQLILVLLVTTLLYFYLRDYATSYPPGPFRLPVIENLHQVLLAGSVVKFCEKYRRQYGNVFTVRLGGKDKVVLSGYHNHYNVLVRNADYSSLKNPKALDKSSEQTAMETPGLIWAPFPHWKNLRTLSIRALREEGMGKSTMEPKILEEIDLFISHFIKPNIGQPVSVNLGLTLLTHNLISNTMFSKRYDYDDKEARHTVNTVTRLFQLFEKLILLYNVPFAACLLRSVEKRKQHYMHGVLFPKMLNEAEAHSKTLDADNPRDLMDRILLQARMVHGSERHYYSDCNIAAVAIQLYGAGFEATANAIHWALLYMCLHPQVQRKVQHEIDDIIGVERAVTMKDRTFMPYTEAVILETLRRSNVAPIPVPHTLEKNLVVEGKVIPAGADIILNMTSILYGEIVFEEPDKFKPERYLTGDVTLKKQQTVPFSMGRRACPGESLVKMEMFICFVTLLQRYNLSLPHDSKATDDTLGGNIFNSPKPFEIRFNSR